MTSERPAHSVTYCTGPMGAWPSQLSHYLWVHMGVKLNISAGRNLPLDFTPWSAVGLSDMRTCVFSAQMSFWGRFCVARGMAELAWLQRSLPSLWCSGWWKIVPRNSTNRPTFRAASCLSYRNYNNKSVIFMQFFQAFHLMQWWACGIPLYLSNAM